VTFEIARMTKPCGWSDRLNEIHPIDGAYIKANTPSWYNARRGRLTASRRAMLVLDKSTWPTMLKEIKYELSDNWKHEHRDSVAMSWGRDNEPRALGTLELQLGLEIEDPGLIFHSVLPFIAGTPDGVFTRNGKKVSLQIKCPYNPGRHLDHIYGKAIKEQYWYQVQCEAWLLGAEEILFASYDPRQPMATQLGLIDIPIHLDTQKRFMHHALEFAELVNSGSRPATGKLSIDSGIPEIF
jgi:YqaJ-like viral recombinase domain